MRLRGFTLLEALVAMALFLVIIVALSNVILSFYTLFSTEQATVDVSYSAHAVMRAVTDAAAQADRIVSSHAFFGTTYTTGPSVVVFELPSVDSSGNTLGSYDYVAVVASSTDAYEYTDAASGSARASRTRHLSDVLSSLVFTYGAADPTQASEVSAIVQTAMSVHQKTISETVSQAAYLRNKP